MTWLYLSIASAFLFSCLNLLSRVVSVDSKNPRALSIAFNTVSASMAIIIFIISKSYQRFNLPSNLAPYLFLVLMTLGYGFFERLRFYATKAVDASVLTVVANIAVVVSVTISFFLYSEVLTLKKALGFFLILASLLLVSNLKKTKITFKKLVVPIIAYTCLGIAWGLDKKGISNFGVETYNIITWLLPQIVLFLPSINVGDVKEVFKKHSWKIVLLSFFNVSAYLIMLKAFILADATKVIPINQTSTIMTVLLGIYILKEKDHFWRKIISGMIAFIGVILLV